MGTLTSPSRCHGGKSSPCGRGSHLRASIASSTRRISAEISARERGLLRLGLITGDAGYNCGEPAISKLVLSRVSQFGSPAVRAAGLLRVSNQPNPECREVVKRAKSGTCGFSLCSGACRLRHAHSTRLAAADRAAVRPLSLGRSGSVSLRDCIGPAASRRLGDGVVVHSRATVQPVPRKPAAKPENPHESTRLPIRSCAGAASVPCSGNSIRASAMRRLAITGANTCSA
jgi:hypothetical protein